MTTDLYGLLPEELEVQVAELGQPRYRADQVLQALYRAPQAPLEEFIQVPVALRAALGERGFVSGTATEVRRVVSGDSETTKLLLRMADGTLVETVLMQYREDGGKHPRSTVCVSTQAGCAMGCVFCATGQMGFERNLTAAEVVQQVVFCANVLRERGEHVTNVVFMGMGEPLANYRETVRAVRILTDRKAFGLGQRHVTISTVGVIRGIDRLAGEGLQVGLAISLHAPDEELRQRLVPTAGPTSVRDLIAAADRYFRKTGRRVTLEYALMAGENDSPATAAALARLIGRRGIHVNLIPINPTAGGFKRPSRARTLEFERVLRDAGVNCTVRVEKGAEISAACGQLRTDAANPVVADVSLLSGGRGTSAASGTPNQAPSQSR